MPTYERRFFLNLYVEEMNSKNEAQESRTNNSKGKKTISGEALKNDIRDNKITL